MRIKPRTSPALSSKFFLQTSSFNSFFNNFLEKLFKIQSFNHIMNFNSDH